MGISLANIKLCFVGAGAMAEAIIQGLIEQKKAHADHLFIVNRHNQNRLLELQQRYGVQVNPDSKIKNRFIQQADIIILAVKPKDVVKTLQMIKPLLHQQQLLISVVAGLSIHTIQNLLALKLPIVRTMPNTSSTIGLGATGICFSEQVGAEQQALTMEIFQAIGITCTVEEPLMDTVTGLSGSGPAYIYYVIESLIAAGIAGGLTEAQATDLTLQTVLGAVQMVRTTNETPEILRQKVTSPGGSTQAAIEVLNQYQMPEVFKKAVMRSRERAVEMGEELSASIRK